MTTLTKKLNRAELLQMAIDGKVTEGDKFKDERDWTVTFDGFAYRWESGNTLTATLHPEEFFTQVVVDKEVTITLKQSEINDLAITLGESIHSNLRTIAQQEGVSLMTTGSEHTRLFHKFQNMKK